jgi:hypothetical protein
VAVDSVVVVFIFLLLLLWLGLTHQTEISFLFYNIEVLYFIRSNEKKR